MKITNIHQFQILLERLEQGELVKSIYAEVVKLVDTHVSGACGASCAGSSPAFGTN